jgi:hypothetical protein
MVRGVEHFRDWFASYTDHYALIGGTACDLILEEAGLAFRATKDLDIVLIVDAVTPEFARRFWDYIRTGGYTHRLKSSGKLRAYRFQEPTELVFPHMIELFARLPDVFEVEDRVTAITPLPVDDPGVSSLSAIILKDDYFSFLRSGITEIEGVPIVDASSLIVLKAHAWLDLRSRKGAGETIESHQIKKHRNDIFRLFPVLNPGQTILLPEAIRDDMAQALALLREERIAVVDMGIRTVNQEEVIEELEKIYVHRS